ncbi:asparagine synthase B [Candidatus Kapaibacterium sp.]
MCGFVGGNTIQNTDELKFCLEKIVHRGRDFTGIYQDNLLLLGHNRLSIQDLSNLSNQPFISNSDNTVLVYSGELWEGYKELKSKMCPEYNFKSDSDTEFIVALFEKYGTDSFKMLDGMFSFVIYDIRALKLYLVRDWIGKVPFYYFQNKTGDIIFSNEIKAFSHLKEVKEFSYLVNSVRPSHFLCYDLRTKKIEVTRYYSFAYSKEYGGEFDLTDSPEVIAKNIRQKLEISVKKRLISDAPLCVLLSGGIDSIITTYLAKKFIPDIEAFTVSIGDTGKKDDLYYARIAAEEFGIKLNEVILNPDQILETLDETIYAIEDSDWRQISTAIVQIPLAREIGRRGFKVAIGGEGSDEIFASYAHIEAFHYKPEAFHKQRKKLIDNIHLTNLRRTNCAMFWGGTVEMRSPFLDKNFVEYSINIPAHYAWRFGNSGSRTTKPLLREAFKGEISDELLNRKKVPTGEGAHSQDIIKKIHLEDKNYFKNKLNILLNTI